MDISAKIYYEKHTGQVLQITSEMTGNVSPTTKEQDMAMYDTLKNFNENDVDFITLEYGTLAETFGYAKEWYVDTENKKLIIEYFTEEEIKDFEANIKKPLDVEAEIEQLKRENADLLYQSAMYDVELEQLKNDLADLTLEVALGGMN